MMTNDSLSERPAQRPQHSLPPLRLLRPRAQHGGADVNQLKHDTGHNVYTNMSVREAFKKKVNPPSILKKIDIFSFIFFSSTRS